MRGPALSPEQARLLNFAGMMVLIGVLLGAYVYQFSYRELPCTLCLLQRLAMLAIAFGAAMNLMLGPSPRYYGVCLLAAIFGLGVSIRQTLLHINPFFDKATGQPTLDAAANPAFGHPVVGLHLYVWGLVIFATVILAAGIVLLFRGQFEEVKQEPQWLIRLAAIGVVVLFVTAAVETLAVFLECGLGDCPNDGSWNWWILR